MEKDKNNENTEALTSLTQAELDNIISKHEAFKAARSNGARAILQHYDLSGLSFEGKDMSNADFTGSMMVETNFTKTKLDCAVLYACDLRKADFSKSSLVRADLRGACLRGAIMANANMSEADLREGSYATYDPEKGLTFTSDSDVWKEGTGGVDMRGANLSSVKLAGTIAINSNFEDANMSKSTIVRGNLSGANLKGANLSGADLSQCELKNVNLKGANLVGVKMDFSNLENVDMEGALTDKPTGQTLDSHELSLEELLEKHHIWIKTHGAKGKNLDLSDHDLRETPPLVGANLTMLVAARSIWYGRDLSRISLQAAMLGESDFRQCLFVGADLRGTNFSKSNMTGANFSRAHLEPLFFEGGRELKTSFVGANLRYADFSGASVKNVNFTGADLSAANFVGANIQGAVFTNAKMEDTKMPKGK
ncbi:MAG TPA: pentapeptide repeat-containing protein [Rhodospirillaceae bacterium]|nr:pentapeptide repeat-containing protein [Rhodospirillaceae bacterium]